MIVSRAGTSKLSPAPQFDDMKGKWQVGSKRREEAVGLVLLVDYPKAELVVDGVPIALLVYPDGIYEYTAVSGGRKTVQKYTASVARALEAESR